MVSLLKDVFEENNLRLLDNIDLDASGQLLSLEKMFQGKGGDQFSEPVPPDWKNIELVAYDLSKQSRDLWCAYYLTTSMMINHGLEGLICGLEFTYKLIDNYWESLYPGIDDEDDEDKYYMRLAPLRTMFALTEPLYINFLQLQLNSNPKVLIDSFIPEKKNDFSSDKFNVIADHLSSEDIEDIKADIETIYDCCRKINSKIDEKVGEVNNRIDAGKFIGKVGKLLARFKCSCESEAVKFENDSSGVQIVSDTITNSESGVNFCFDSTKIKETLEQICDWYRANEPSSPVPFMLDRTISMIGKSFAELLQELAAGGINDAQLVLGSSFVESVKKLTDSGEANAGQDGFPGNMQSQYSGKMNMPGGFDGSGMPPGGFDGGMPPGGPGGFDGGMPPGGPGMGMTASGLG